MHFKQQYSEAREDMIAIGFYLSWLSFKFLALKKNQHPSIDSLSMNDFVSEVFWRQQMDFFPISYLYLLNGDLRDKEVFISF